ncbi:MAG: amidohydrolase [Proteobacteria bacterium]|nr:amidohydrolase [Pseudomonadota bacterium]HOL37334.1 M20 aminoacylase family protein [Rubrivivax sp.]
MNLIDAIVADSAAMSAIRRDLHAHPELGYEETRTADLVASQLTQWGIPVHRGLGKTGVVGIVQNGSSARALGLRADMDALPMTEFNRFAHASRHPGKMHGCGHDGHTTMLLAAARQLARQRDFDGTVVLIFQPAEEGGAGAQAMIDDGLLERFAMEAVFGMHNWPGYKVGTFGVTAGPMMASASTFGLKVRGKGAHAALAYMGVDPVPVACQIVLAWQTIVTRNLRALEAAVISPTMIHAGEASNVIPESAEVKGTVRTLSGDALALIERRMREVAEGVCAAHGAGCEFEFTRGYPVTVNHEAETGFVRRVLGDVAGSGNVLDFEPTMGSEDFAFFLQQRPGCYFVIGNGDGAHRAPGHGAGPCTLHNPNYDFNDALIALGATAWVRIAEAWLARR